MWTRRCRRPTSPRTRGRWARAGSWCAVRTTCPVRCGRLSTVPARLWWMYRSTRRSEPQRRAATPDCCATAPIGGSLLDVAEAAGERLQVALSGLQHALHVDTLRADLV